MRKSTRIVRKLLALFLVVLMSIENFAAVVSDNDGSAFITKAEFDSLKNDFQSQINQYNTSIDAKIDGAIASYLAGISLSKDTTYKVEVSDWDNVVMIKSPLTQTWQKPNLSIAFSYTANEPSGTVNWYEMWWAQAGISHRRADDVYQLRNCVNAGTESRTNTAPDNVVWRGRANNYVDTITANQIGHVSNYLTHATFSYSYMLVVDALKFGSGYIPGLSLSNKYAGGCAWNADATGSGGSITTWINNGSSGATWFNSEVITSVNLVPVNEKQYSFEHIGTFNDETWTSLSDPNWANTLNDNPSFSQEDVLTSTDVVKSGIYHIYEINDTNPPAKYTNADWEGTAKNYSGTMTGSIKSMLLGGAYRQYNSGHGKSVTSADKMKSVGVLDKTYTSEHIYQWSGKRKLNRDENISYEKINLYNGALIAYAKQDETFKWEPVIKGTYDNGGTDVAITKWRVKLSDKPFGTGESLGTGGKVLKNAGQTNDYIVTDDTGKCKFNFQLGDNTTIWCKWWPDDTNICNNYNWKGTLDLTQCGTYTITEA